jgi:hypothetical protein
MCEAMKMTLALPQDPPWATIAPVSSQPPAMLDR